MFMSADPKKRFMENESIPRLLARFAAPALVGMLAHALYNIVDRIFVGQVVGARGIGALVLSFPCMLLFFSVSFLIGVGAASRISILLGEKRLRRAEQTLGNAFMMALVASVLLWVAGRFFFRSILFLSGASETLYPMAASYLSIILYGTPFSVISFSLSCQIRACGSPMYAMGSQLVGAFANIILDALFVLGFGMGVSGAAIATVMSQFLSMVWALSYFRRPDAALRLRLPFILRPDLGTLKRIFAVGTPSCLVNLNFVMVHGMITNMSSHYGGDLAVSATGIFMSLDSLLFMPAIAISEACQPIIGYNYGAGKIGRVISTVKMGVIACTAFYLLSFTLVMTNAELMAMMFESSDKDLIHLAATGLRIGNLGIPLMGVSLICTSFMQGLGRGREGLYLAFVRIGLFLWTPLLILPRYFGVYGAWGSFPISDICGSVVAGLFMVHTVKKLRLSHPS